MEAEYISASLAAKEIVWLKKMLIECHCEIKEYMLFVDNVSAIKVVKNPELHQHSKHIDIKYYFVRDLYEKGEINVEYVNTDEQTADVFTKALAKPRFLYLRSKLGLVKLSEIKDKLVQCSNKKK